MRHTSSPASPRRDESGWVLIASLLVASVLASLTVTWARHAVLAKKSLEVASGASLAEESSRSGLERTRQRMRQGDLPGPDLASDPSPALTPAGDLVSSERKVVDQKTRQVRVNARSENSADKEREATLRARAEIVPSSGAPPEKRARLTCETGSALLAAGLMTIISTDTTIANTQLAGLYLLEEGVDLTLQNCVLRGTILTRPGLCKDAPMPSEANRPRVRMFGDVRLLAGTELPEVAACGPDLRLESDASSRIEIRGFTAADEVKLEGRGTCSGMLVSGSVEEIDSQIDRPGHGRGLESWPSCIEPGSERVMRIAFPSDPVADDVLDLMEDFDCDDMGP